MLTARDEVNLVVTEQQQRVDQQEDQALIERHIAPDPAGRGDAYVRLKDYGTPVWALIGYLGGDATGDVERAAADYAVPPEAVRAALAFYRRHTALIDAKLLLNRAA